MKIAILTGFATPGVATPGVASALGKDNEVGDGTTSLTVLVLELLREAKKLIEAMQAARSALIATAQNNSKDSFLDFLLDKKPGVHKPKRIENAKILIANTQMATDKIKVFGSIIKMDSMARSVELEVVEKEKIKEKVTNRTCGVPLGEACTVVIRWATQLIIDESDRSLHDTLCLLPAETSGKESMAIEACTSNLHVHRKTLQRWQDLDILDSRSLNKSITTILKLNMATKNRRIADSYFTFLSLKSICNLVYKRGYVKHRQ
ncbi:chaperonin [Culex quinquefasciatus]|uniref:Chaperonin n=1 Tax=Culex quinquefasciatus TaxID=7176 RepID=B0XCH2_CULQU|nr:chaperonin [Culex quinquefasciatus]|eukprot:XP_001867344.1 chaperonin [Culex quinquefasciatus]